MEGRGELVVLRPALRLVKRAARTETFASGVLIRLDDRRAPRRPAPRSWRIGRVWSIVVAVAVCAAVLVIVAR